MANNITQLIIILAISGATFLYLIPAIKPAVNAKDFKLWGFSWLGITTTAFISINSAMLFALIGFIIYTVSKKVDNKAALYFILFFLVPGYVMQTPLINITYQTIVGIFLLFPLSASLFLEKKDFNAPKSRATLVLAIYLIWVFILQYRGLEEKSFAGFYMTHPQMIKRGFQIFLELFLPFYVASHYIKNFQQVKEVIFAFIMTCLLLSPLALYELVTSSALFASLPNTLDGNFVPAYVRRSGLLRALVSIEHPLYLGILIMIAISLFLFVANYIKNKLLVIIGFGILALGFIAPLSRGPWTGAALMAFIVYLFSANKLRNGLIIFSIISFILIALLNSEHADKVISFLPFVGSVDTGNVDYRGLLFEQSLFIIEEFPIFGMYEPRFHEAMEPLYQGEGIVDFVNVYISIAAHSGLVGLFLYLTFTFIVLFSLAKELLAHKDKRSLEYKCGVSLIGALLGLMLVMVLVSNTYTLTTIFLTLCGIIISYVKILKQERSKTVDGIEMYSTTRVVN